jgi:hypothetical protein
LIVNQNNQGQMETTLSSIAGTCSGFAEMDPTPIQFFIDFDARAVGGASIEVSVEWAGTPQGEIRDGCDAHRVTFRAGDD